jgi:hypothetical protein
MKPFDGLDCFVALLLAMTELALDTSLKHPN